MPGKGDFGSAADGNLGAGMYAIGSKEYKAHDEGWNYRYGGTALERPITGNPFNQTERPVEYQAWRYGWNDANAAIAGTQKMPYNTGAAPA